MLVYKEAGNIAASGLKLILALPLIEAARAIRSYCTGISHRAGIRSYR